MLPKTNRLVKDKDFKNVFKEGRAFSSPSANVKLAKNNLKNSRFGFVISNKITKKATQRNKFRRQLREIIRLKLEKIKSGYDVVIIARPQIKEKNYQDLKEDLEKSLKRLKILN